VLADGERPQHPRAKLSLVAVLLLATAVVVAITFDRKAFAVVYRTRHCYYCCQHLWCNEYYRRWTRSRASQDNDALDKHSLAFNVIAVMLQPPSMPVPVSPSLSEPSAPDGRPAERVRLGLHRCGCGAAAITAALICATAILAAAAAPASI
jgi:hypothetical protein